MWTSFEHVAATNADKENSPRVDGLMTAGLTESPLKRRREHALPNSVPGACSVSVPTDQHSVQPSAGSGIDAVQSQAVQLSSVKEQIAQLQREVASTKKTMSKLHSDKDQPIRSSQPNMNAPAQNVCSTSQSQLSDREQSKVETYSPSQHEGSGQAMQSSEAEMAKIEGVLLEFRGLQERYKVHATERQKLDAVLVCSASKALPVHMVKQIEDRIEWLRSEESKFLRLKKSQSGMLKAMHERVLQLQQGVTAKQ
jgi:uncharacterized small protein (DUF1192 family)